MQRWVGMVHGECPLECGRDAETPAEIAQMEVEGSKEANSNARFLASLSLSQITPWRDSPVVEGTATNQNDL